MASHTKQIKEKAIIACKKNNAQLTPLRETVLDLLLQYHGVLKAYQLLNDMQALRENVAPPTVYRALDFWVTQGILHKVQSLGGYILCQHDDHKHCQQGLILLCEECQNIFEQCGSVKSEELRNELAQKGFKINMDQLVITGTCQACQNKK